MAGKTKIEKILEDNGTIQAKDLLRKDQMYIIMCKTDEDVPFNDDINAIAESADDTAKDSRIEDSAGEHSDVTELKDTPRLGQILVIEKLAKGGFGITYTVMHSNDSTGKVKTKAVLKEALDGNSSESIEEEINIFKILSEAQHKNIIMQLFACKQINPDEHYLGLEFFNGKTLARITETNARKNKDVSDKDLFHILRQQTEAIDFLQSAEVQIYHGDITPSNVMYQRATRVSKLIDFGLSVHYKTPGAEEKHVVCTMTYAAPETLADGIIGEHSDVYGLAATLFYVVAKTPPSWCSEETKQQIMDKHGSLESEESKEKIKTSSKEEIERHRQRLTEAKSSKDKKAPDTKVQEELVQYVESHSRSLIDTVKMMLNVEGSDRSSPIDIADRLDQLEKSISDDSADEASFYDSSDPGIDSDNDEFLPAPTSIQSDGAYATTGDEFPDINALWEGVPYSH